MIAGAILWVFGSGPACVFAAAFLPAFAVGMFAMDPPTKADIVSMITGAVTWFAWTAFVDVAESKPLGICQLIFGKPALLGQPWAAIDPIMIAPPISLFVMVAMQYMGKPFKGNPVPAT
jgi:SSS family solute:Na+ symporter